MSKLKSTAEILEGLDSKSAMVFVRKKIPEWHDRLNKNEDNFQLLKSDIDIFKRIQEDMSLKLNAIHEAIVGTVDGKQMGFIHRLEILERFKKNIYWAASIIYISTVGAIWGWISRKLPGA